MHLADRIEVLSAAWTDRQKFSSTKPDVAALHAFVLVVAPLSDLSEMLFVGFPRLPECGKHFLKESALPSFLSWVLADSVGHAYTNASRV